MASSQQYTPRSVIAYVGGEYHYKEAHSMNDTTSNIINDTLESYGVVEKQKETKKTDKKTEMPPIPDFLDRRKTRIADTRQKSWKPTTSRVPSPESWKKDDVITKLDELRESSFECLTGSPDATIEKQKLDDIVSIITTDLGNALEHTGLVYKYGTSPSRLRDALREFILSETKYNNGSMYRQVVSK